MDSSRGCAAVLAAAAVALAAAPADASPLELFGFGARSPAMAGTGVAFADGYDAVYLNPAGLARVERKRATVGGMAGAFGLEIDDVDQGVDGTRALVLGGALPLPLGGAAKDRVGLGFGFHVPTDTLNRARAPYPGTPDFVLLANRSQVIAVQVAAGVRVRANLDVGLGVIALAVLRGGIHVATDAAGRFATTSEQQLLTRFAPVAGVRWRRGPRLAVGGTLRWVSRSDYDIDVTTDIGDVVPIALPPIRIAGNAQYDPLTVAVEVAFRPSPRVLYAAQLQWQRWSAFPLPTVNPVSGTPPQEPPGFHDTVVPRLGAELTATLGPARLAARAGAAFHASPAPEARGRQSLLDNHRLVGGLGLGVALPGASVPLVIDAWFQHHLLLPRRHAKDAAAFEPGEVAPFSVIDTGGEVLVGGIAVGVDL